MIINIWSNQLFQTCPNSHHDTQFEGVKDELPNLFARLAKMLNRHRTWDVDRIFFNATRFSWVYFDLKFLIIFLGSKTRGFYTQTVKYLQSYNNFKINYYFI